ncbi:hypothetical protein [Streptomyces achromogenes]|uniref:hypothetical protein n=1 Tax=Streptomyces achromogenes TaxID=67255 RepID=UPI003F4D03F6
MRDALAALPVHDEDRTGYQRDAFRHWVDADKDGCTTRAEVLKAEAVIAPAWDSGASAWSAAEREAYANDVGDERALIAVSAASNRSKADQDPTTWLPPAAGYHWQYATDWVADKTR